jgi:hypothetical protein
MRHARVRGLGGRGIQHFLSKIRTRRSASDRLEALSELLLGSSYAAHPLIGSPNTPEVFTASLEGFDCVTYVETVLALSCARRVSEFVERLRKIRYDDGQIEWSRRNHYMTGWIRNNVRIGVVRPISGSLRMTRKDRLLDAVPGLPPRRTRFACVPKRLVKELEARLRTGDLIFFASTRKHLDVFHCGILVKAGDRWRLRHAARSRQSVVEQDLDEFLKSNRMAGVIVVRPTGEIGERSL